MGFLSLLVVIEIMTIIVVYWAKTNPLKEESSLVISKKAGQKESAERTTCIYLLKSRQLCQKKLKYEGS
jgi:hypothetical protein